MMNRVLAFVLLFTGLMFPCWVSAEFTSDRHPWFDSKFLLSGGAYFTDHEYKLGAGVNLPDEDIDFNDSFGVDNNQTSFTGSLRWNFGEKWSFRAQVFTFDVDGSAVLTKDINWDDNTLKAGSNVSAGVSNRIIRGFFGRKFSEGPKHEFGAGIGLHWMTVEAYAAGEAITDDGNATQSVRGEVDADLPLPNIGFWYWYAPSPRWLITSRVDWLSASVGDYSGGLWNVGVGGQFQVSDHWGVGAEWSYFSVDGDVDKSDWRGSLEASSNGPAVYVSVNW